MRRFLHISLSLFCTSALVAASLTGCYTTGQAAVEFEPVDLSTSPLMFGQSDLYLRDQVDTPPEPVGGYEAILGKVEYPEEARKQRMAGLVVIAALVEKDGSVSKYHLHQGIGKLCDDAAMRAVQGLRFTPGMLNDKPVRVLLPLRFEFRTS